MMPPESEKRPRSGDEAAAVLDASVAPVAPDAWDPEFDPGFDPEFDQAPMRRPPVDRPDLAAALAGANDDLHWVGDVQPSEAQAYLEPTTLPPTLVAPTLDMASIVVRAELDPRRADTVPSGLLPAVRKSAAATQVAVVTEDAPREGEGEDAAIEVAPVSKWARDARAPEIDRAALPSSHAPSSRPPPHAPSSRPPPSVATVTLPMSPPGAKPADKRRGWMPVAGAVVAVMVAGVVVRVATQGRTDASEAAGASSSGSSPTMSASTTSSSGAVAMASGTPTASEALPVAVGAAPMKTGAAPTGVVPTATGLASPPAPTVRPAPKATVDPYADAGALPSVNSAQPALTLVPAASSAPSAPSPTLTAVPGPKSSARLPDPKPIF